MVRTISTNVSRAIVARLLPGEDILPALEKIVTEQKIKSGQLTLIGAISGARLGYFDFGNKVYTDFTVDEDLEVVGGIL
ncbi:MAG: PCC domain-containing protein, partial [Candidatus Hodarchaeota archaeon]